MAETKKIVIEGEFKLAYFVDERDSKHILIKDDTQDNASGAVAVGGETQRRLESFIADQLSFPDDGEFDEMFRKLEDLRSKGLRPAEGTPDGVREGVRLRVTVEVL